MAVKDNYEWVRLSDTDKANLIDNSSKLLKLKFNERVLCFGKIDDVWHAIDDECPHAGASLSAGFCDSSGQVECPLHSIKFDLKNGKNTTGEGYSVKHYPVKEEGDFLFVGFPKRKKFWFW